MWALHEEEMDLSTHSSGEKATAFESEKSSSLYFELILTTVYRTGVGRQIMNIYLLSKVFEIDSIHLYHK